MRDSTRLVVRARERGFARWRPLRFLALALAGAMLLPSVALAAPDFSVVPGSVIAYSNYSWNLIGAPSLSIMSDGTYISAQSYGSGTWVHKSTDRGQTWAQVGTVADSTWGTVFELNNALYFYGYEDGGGDTRIWKSTNKGTTWSSYTTLYDGNDGGSPNTPSIYNGRVWLAVNGNRVISAPITSDLMVASSWTRSNGVSFTNHPFGGTITPTEGQTVASPTTGVVLLPKVRGLPYTAKINVTSASSISFDGNAENAYPSLPGGEKKFGVQYDATSGRFYALTNAVLPAHANDPEIGDEPEMIRNTATMLSSKDLIHWDVEKIFLYTPNIDNGSWGEAFQYLNFSVDGTDLAVVSRTAMDVDDWYRPDRGHDANMATFHRISNFRTATSDQYLKITSGSVSRHERTGHRDAPLGTFALGTTFAGAALTSVNAVAKDSANYVYLRETTGGRMLKFDAAGNFISTVTSLPSGTSWTTGSQTIVAPGRDNRAWIKNASATWDDQLNWQYWGRPDTNEEIATLGSAINSGTVNITMNGNYTVKGLRYMPATGARYLIGGGGTLTLEADSGRALIDVRTANIAQRLDVSTKLNSDTDVTIAASTILNVYGDLNLNGKALYVTSNGLLQIQNGFKMGGGKVVANGLGYISFCNALGDNTLDGDLQFTPDASLSLNVGSSFNLMDGESYLGTQRFTNIYMPELANLRGWSLDTLYTNGNASIISVTAPEWTKNAAADWADVNNWKYYSRPDSDAEIATFGSAITVDRSLSMNNSYTLKGLRFLSSASSRYTIIGNTAAGAKVTLQADTGRAVIDVQDAHTPRLYLDIKLNSDTDVTVAQAGAELNFYYSLDLNGKTMYVTGNGKTNIRDNFKMGGGKLVVDGVQPVVFKSTSKNTLDGDLQFTPNGNVQLVLGQSYELIAGESYLNGETFDHIYLPTLAVGQTWDISTLYTSGLVKIVAAVPEPGAVAILLTGAAFFMFGGRRLVNRGRRGRVS